MKTCSMCNEEIKDGETFMTNKKKDEFVHTNCIHLKAGYDAAIADVVAFLFLESDMTNEFLESINRGDAKGYAKKVRAGT